MAVTFPPRMDTSVGNDRIPLDPALQATRLQKTTTTVKVDTPQAPSVQSSDWWKSGYRGGNPLDLNSGREITGKLFGLDGPFEYTGMGAHQTDATTGDQSQHETVPFNVNTDTQTAAAAIIRREEGFAPAGAWDVNAYRGGYGSDTYTTKDGQVVKIGRGQAVSKDDAERDVQRRIPILAAQNAKQLGPNWSKLPGYAQGVLIATADNYGHVPAAVARAVQAYNGGSLSRIADAVEALGADNGGIRRARYKRGADIIRGIGVGGEGP